MVPPTSHHRHQVSLEELIDFAAVPSLNQAQRTAARDTFYSLVNSFDSEDAPSSTLPYSRTKLIRYTFEYSLSQDAQDNFLWAFFRAIDSPFDGQGLDLDKIRPYFHGFADYLIDHFFLPCIPSPCQVAHPSQFAITTNLRSNSVKAAGTKTPQPSPIFRSAIRDVQSTSSQAGFIGTPDRLASLRGFCLTRDRYRCVISRTFDWPEAIRRLRQDPNATDEDGNSLAAEAARLPFQALEVAHILPHSLAQTSSEDMLLVSLL